MDHQEDDIIEQLKAYPDQFEAHEELTAKAVELTRELYGKGSKYRRRKNRIRAIWSVASCAVVLAVALPVGLHFGLNGNQSAYFLGIDLQEQLVDTLDETIQANDLSLHYFSGQIESCIQCKNQVYIITETNEFAYILQTTLFLSSNNFDTVELGINPTVNTYEAFKEFIDLEETEIISDISVSYQISTLPTSEQKQILASFSKDKVSYYMSIETAQTEGALEHYINLLFTE